MLKRLGMRRRELVRTIYCETGLVMLICCFAGSVFGLLGQILATLYARQITGFPEACSPAPLRAVGTLLLATAISALATAIFGVVVTRSSMPRRG